MVLFYGWTNTQLINLVNVKVNYFNKVKADLIILKIDRISENLVKIIESNKIFRKVIFIEQPPFNSRSLNWGNIPIIRTIAYGNASREYYNKMLKANFGDTEYSIMLTAGYWAETVFLLKYFYKKNPKITVSFVEEGVSEYYEDKAWLCKIILGGGIKEKIIRIIYFGWFSTQCNKKVNSMYLYEPRLCRNKARLQLYKLPHLNGPNQKCMRILHGAMAGIDLSQYKKRYFYYIDTPILKDNSVKYDKTKQILKEIVEATGKEQIIIKIHPITNKKSPGYAKEYEPEVFVDRKNYLFESLFAQIDLEKKILITWGSSVVMYPKFMFGKEPYVIFIHGIENTFDKYMKPRVELYASDLVKCYNDKKRVLVVESILELRKILKNINELVKLDI